MRRIYMVMAAGLVLTGTALFSGCSNNELLEMAIREWKFPCNLPKTLVLA